MKYLMVVTLVFCSGISFAASKAGFLINTTLTYKDAGKDITAKKKFILPGDSTMWTPLTDFKDNVVLLGRAVKVESSAIHLEYILIDGNKNPTGIISVPNVVATIGKPAEIKIDKDTIGMATPEISISLTAEKTRFATKPQ